MKYCPQCGTKLEENMKFCPECGQSLTGSDLAGKKSYEDYLIEELRRPSPWARDEHDSLIWRELLPKLIDQTTVTCRKRRGEVHTALVVTYEDRFGNVTRKVKCRGDCSDCPYGDVE